jgi:hypothetical protein
VTSSARCAVRRQAKGVRQPSYPQGVPMLPFPDWKGAGPYLTILAGAAKAIDL